MKKKKSVHAVVADSSSDDEYVLAVDKDDNEYVLAAGYKNNQGHKSRLTVERLFVR